MTGLSHYRNEGFRPGIFHDTRTPTGIGSIYRLGDGRQEILVNVEIKNQHRGGGVNGNRGRQK